MSVPKFIIIDGVDGSGKSTVVESLKDYLQTVKGLKVKVVHVVESTILAGHVKKYLKDEDSYKASDTSLGFLFCAAISDSIERLIKPAIEEGYVVICDRYTPSTRVYQSTSPYIDKMCDMIDNQLMPDLTVILDVPPRVILKRIGVRGADMDSTESHDIVQISDRRRKYANIASTLGVNAYVVDASNSPSDVEQRVFNIVDTYY